MSSKIRKCVNGLNQQQDVKTLLPEYVKQSMELHDSYARVNMMMEYYLFYEVISEGINPYIESAQETIDALNQVIGQVFSQDYTEEQGKIWRDALLSMRQEVMDRMQVLTGYVDCFVVYEYILNRIQYRFEEREMLPADTEFAQEVMNFIFGSQDSVTINDNLRLVIGQLPMRMTRRHYFDLIRECISVYKGSDRSALEGFLYMFRTSAMLYQGPEREKYFTEFAVILEELAQVDFDHMDRKMYDIYAEKIRINASKLNDLSDLYMQIGELINETYTVVVAAPYITEAEPMTQADQVIRGIHALFTGEEDPVWEQAEGSPDTEEERLAWLGEKLTFAEGKQEKLYDSINVAEAALEEIVQSQDVVIEEMGMQEAFGFLHQVSMLNSNSVFAPLEVEMEEVQVTVEMAEAETEKLIGELKELFQGQSRMLRRAIMAGTVEKLPTLFSSAQEVADYIINSLNQCDDEAEKYASKQLILDLIH